MPLPENLFLPKALPASPLQRLKTWWSRLTPQRQDRFAMLAPLAAVVLFLVAILSAFAYLRLEEISREREAISRDVEYTQQRLRLRLLEQQEQLGRFAREVASREISHQDFLNRAEALVNLYPEVQGLAWIDERRRVRVDYHTANRPMPPQKTNESAKNSTQSADNFALARQLLVPIYSAPQTTPGRDSMLELHLPLIEQAKFKGTLLALYSVDALFLYGIPNEINAKYAMSLQDAQGKLLAGTTISASRLKRQLLPWASPINAYEMPVSPIGNGLTIQGQAYRTSLGVIGSGLFWLVMVLSAITAWLLLANWSHTRRRIQAQDALVQETAFRRAMENSILTGMRTMDLQGRITYVNTAFCQMTGWSEEELVGQTAPFPYWPEEDYEMLKQRLKDELSGNILPSGIHFRVKRKDGVIIEARLYVSPLIDAFGQQTGWMTSMIDITEPTRVREQLAASYERFTTVLEALDASISVAPLGSSELLFANKLYRQWFSAQADGHVQLVAEAGVPPPVASDETQDEVDAFAGLPTNQLADKEAESAEIYLGTLGRWLEVRTRYLSWVDGRLAQMVIATDITARRNAEQQSQVQAERAQTASRLITMGEMASSVAHELNQPLTAINNYCNGMVSRIRSKQINEDELLGALEKTAKQAHRAGQIIHHIRSFVKRSEPNRTLSNVATMVTEAVELAEIELRRRNVKLSQYLVPRLPMVLVDPILIEQVLLNLLKNAAESVDAAQRPTAQRLIKLTVAQAYVNDKPVIEFKVVDSGAGISPDMMEHLYEAFYSTKAEGMGIGLSLCRSIVESHMGRMKAENLYNGAIVTGCCFTFWIPVAEPLPTAPTKRFVQPTLQIPP
ncbi:PAS domain-containing sensor histidine kinase [Rhodoferax sp.]|uniref:PAS domain-containing sensor histidine kinase n=1 Tax=Rhodoferax sp. TaxID=50421 RepID=UPI002726EC80|nr:PAS domain-containing sensor histidine kinase [Rhodoferax sp.]MDO9143760.1 PAS domain S-box protein [Rhodoferax sp.]MDP3865677.1 PAS domain S-box protein [Rhodoferax sp.]